MPRVTHFEIHADDPERAITFYNSVFDWAFHAFGGDYWMVTTGPNDQPGINGGLVRRRGAIDGEAVIAYVCSIDVPDLDACLAAVQAAGGQQVVPKQAIPGMGWFAHIKDTEGNVVGLQQQDPGVA